MNVRFRSKGHAARNEELVTGFNFFEFTCHVYSTLNSKCTIVFVHITEKANHEFCFISAVHSFMPVRSCSAIESFVRPADRDRWTA